MKHSPKTKFPMPVAKSIKLFFGSLLVFASLATAGQAESFYPKLIQEIRPSQTPDVIRICTGLELAAEMKPVECGTLTLAEVVSRMYAVQHESSDD